MNKFKLKKLISNILITLTLLVVSFMSAPVFAAPFNDAATGDWDIGTTWGGVCAAACTEGTDYPGSNDTATIDSHTVTLTADHNVDDVTIAAGGTLSAGSNRLIVSGGWSNTGGTFTAGTSTVLFRSTASENIDPDNDAFNDLIINDGLVIYMKFDETAANTCTGGTNDSCDSSGYGKDGSWTGTAASNANIPTLNFINARSIDLDGNSDFVSISNPQLPTGDFTYAAWIDVDSTADEMIVMSPNTGGANELIFRVSGGRLNTFTNNGNRLTSASSVSTGWTHVAVTRTGSTIRHYIDGVLDANTATDGTAFDFGNCPVYIGTDTDVGCASNTGNFFDGQIDDWRAYDRALSLSEIQQLANGNAPGLASGSFTLQDDLDVNGDIYINSGTLDVDSTNNHSIFLAGDWYNFGGTFAAQQGQVILDGGDQSLFSTESFFTLSKTVAAAQTLNFAAESVTTINGTLQLDGAAGQLLSLRSTTSGTRFELDVKMGDQTTNYVDVKDSESSTHNIIALDSTNATGNDDGESGARWYFAAPVNIGGTVYSDEGMTSIGAGKTVAVSINGAAFAASDETDGSGVYSIASLSAVPGDILTVYIDGEVEKSVTVISLALGSIIDLDLYEDHVIVRADYSSGVTNTHLATADDNGDADITGAYSIASGDLTVSAGYDLYVWPSEYSFTPGGSVTTPDLDIFGNMNMETQDLTVSGTLINEDGGVLQLSGSQTLSTNVVTMNSGSSVIYMGDNDTAADTINLTNLSATYYNLTINSFDGDTDEYELNSALTVNGTLDVMSGTFDFKTNNADVTGNWIMGVNSQNVAAGLAGIAVTVGGDMTLTGEGGDLIDLNIGSAWTLDVTGVGMASYVNVQNSDASGGSEIIAFNGTNTNSGSNTNWNFIGATISGRVYSDEGSTNIGIGKTVAVSINGAAAGSTDGTDVNGDYTLIGLNYVANDIVTLYLDDQPEQALLVTVAKSGSLTGMDLYQDYLIVRHENSGSLTNADLVIADNNADTDITDFYTMSSTELTMAGGTELFIGSSQTYAPGDTVTVDDVDINGTLNMASDEAFVDGSWDATGGTFVSSNQVMFRPSASETLTTAGQSFNDLIVNDGLVGYWKFDEGSGNIAYDWSGYGRHGTYTNMDAGDWVAPRAVNFANEYSVDVNTTSTDEYVLLPSSTIDGLTSVTAAYWMKTSKTSNSAVLSGANASSNNEFLIFSGDTSFSFFTASGSTTFTTTSIADGAWHHIVVLRDDPNNEVSIYIDGVADNENPRALGMTTLSIDDGGFLIGQEQDIVGGNFEVLQIFDGTIDELRIYNRLLSATEITRLANGNTPATTLGALTLQDDLDVNGTLGLYSGELDVDSVNDRSINVAGNWNNFGGTFDAHQGTVTLDGGSLAIPASETFYDLTKTSTTAQQMTVGKDSTITISNTLLLNGTSPTSRLQIRSSASGTRFEWDVTSSDQTVSYLDVQDSEATSNDITSNFSINNGGNDDAETTPFWIFPPFGPKKGAIMIVD